MRGRARGNAPGKLTAAARAWATGHGGGAQADQDALTRASDLPAWIRDRSAQAQVEVGPEEVDAVALFIALDTQWQVHPMTGMRLGLRYEAVPAAAAALGLDLNPALFADLRIMEGAALSAWAARP